MTERKNGLLSRKAQAFNRLVAVVETMPDEKEGTKLLSARMPLRVIQAVDRIAEHRKCTRTAVVAMLLDAVLSELAAEGGHEAKKLLGVKGQRDSSRGKASC